MAATKLAPSSRIKANGATKTIREFAELLGCPVQTILGRLARGWSSDRAVTEPISSKGGANRGTTHAAEILVGDEIERLMGAAPKTPTAVRDRAMIVMSYRAGLRCCELLALALKDIDQAARTIRILHGKGDKSRVVAIDSKSWNIVVEWLTVRTALGIADAGPLFCTADGKPIASRQVRAMMARRAKRAGLAKHVHLHGLRHTMASEMAAEGVPLLDISGALGHASAATTNKYLQRLSPTSVIDAMRSRTWGEAARPAATASRIAAPDWLARLRADIGERLMLLHDARIEADTFRAVILLLP